MHFVVIYRSYYTFDFFNLLSIYLGNLAKLYHLLCDCWPFLLITAVLVFLLEMIKTENNMAVKQYREPISMVQMVVMHVSVF